MELNEIWLSMKGWEDLYEVSNFGNVKSLRKNIILKKSVDKDGYLIIHLRNGLLSKNYKIHRLVAEVFIPNPFKKKTVNHIDLNKKNNNVNNLEWTTHLENNNHAIDNGVLNHNGEFNGRAKLSECEVKEIIKLKGLKTQKEIAQMYNVSKSLVGCIINRKNWKHINI
jgi:hypothetical protein